MAKILIVNADDFGANEPTDLGIIDTFERGIVRSASLLGNGGSFDHAVALVRTHRGLDIGVHLNILRGIPLTKPRTLMRADGRLLESGASFIWRYATHHQDAPHEIKAEFTAQIERVLAAGITPSHLDTEKHLHIFPGVAHIVLELAERYSIHAVRFPFESKYCIIQPTLRQRAKILFSRIFERHVYRLFAEHKVARTDHFCGISLSGRFTSENLSALIRTLPEGVTEISCHPSRPGSTYGSFRSREHEEELTTLTNPSIRTLLDDQQITLSSYIALS